MQRKNIYADRVAALRELMKEQGVDAYLIVTDDFHASEYVGDYFKCRGYISGFDGSAGSLVITAAEAGLWTDGRYFLQAERQLEGTGITLRRMGEEGVPTIPAYLRDTLQEGQCLGYDGRTIGTGYAEKLKRELADKGIRFLETKDLVDELWSDRPAFPAEPVWLLEDTYTGCSRGEKLEKVREQMKACGAQYHLLASLDDIAYLYNLRGNDVLYNPVAMSYSLIGEEDAVLYIAAEAVNQEIAAQLAKDGVLLKPYLQVYEDVKNLPRGSKLMLDKGTVNVALCSAVPEGVEILEKGNPTKLMKALKTPVEQENERLAHIQDGVAVTKLIYWLKKNQHSEEFKSGKVTELYVAKKLESLRAERPGYLNQSFDPIIGAGPHGAIVHYEPTEETDIPVVDNSFLLMDTGGQYMQGTTDITRTIVIGTASAQMKEHYTAVLRGHLNLGGAVFKYGCTGMNLDVLARSPLWELGLDYNHGTGHGVGYLLNVHEGPQSIRLKDISGTAGTPLEEGMITSNEPGLYLEGQYGIRTENLTLCRKGKKTDFGQFMYFETLTMVPYDREAILPERMTARELKLLNDYHQKVYDNISPYLTEEEKLWLHDQTRPIKA